MIRILANDGIHATGLNMLKDAGFQVDTDKVAQEDLAAVLPIYDALIVRSATKVRQDLIDGCPDLKAIARGGVGMDNIDVVYAREKGVHVFNTPAASSRAVAELTMGHMLALSRFLHVANRDMPASGVTSFNDMKKSYSKGREIEGRTLGIVGFGRIGQSLAQLALGAGMQVIASDPFVETADLSWTVSGFGEINVTIQTISLERVLAESDFLSVHVPSLGGKPLLGKEELATMKSGAILVNSARGGIIDEDALLEALDSGEIGGAGLDVFVGEPTPRPELLCHPLISVSPHIGASTNEAQSRIGAELANGMIDFFRK
ncbi:MAG: D-2-hydroxyacid dehydrogenase [Saprospiraceae bacterium]|nr:D-2-hydroxyacid dehydrogenase [Saprospiraceae bacterium]